MDKYPTYLVHFNGNHRKNNGQFTFGDGDGDGKLDEWGRYKNGKNKNVLKKMRADAKNAKNSNKNAANSITNQYNRKGNPNYLDDQKLSKTDSAKELVRRHLTYSVNDLYEDDPEERRRKNGKASQSQWGDNYVTG